MAYFREFTLHWPNLLGASVGLALGSALNHYMLNLFGPPLIAEFGWSKAQFALVGSLGLIGLFVMPIAGRFTDRFGTRISAIVGFSVVPAGYFALSLMTGDIWQFYGILLLKNVFGILTTTFVFSRVVVERFDAARGLALAFMLSGAPLAGALAVQLVGDIIVDDGWRAGYRTLALISAIGGIASVILIGRASKTADAKPVIEPARLTWDEFRALCRRPVFLLLVGGMFFCNFPQVLVSSQMNIMLMDNGATAQFATTLVSLYAISVVVGRFASGFALDRVSPHLVAIVALGLPGAGYFALASPVDTNLLMLTSIVLVGLAQGAETDVSAILTSRKFDMRHYSFIFSLLMASMGIASALGSMVLSLTLLQSDSFDTFLIICAVLTLFGAACFFLTGRYGRDDATNSANDAKLVTGEIH
ncbi:MAG: MFS transporter [Novosphingobium sp.]|nr:MFS transporter [Novosphingobium sp.]